MEQKAHREVRNPKHDLSFNLDIIFQYLFGSFVPLLEKSICYFHNRKSPVLPILQDCQMTLSNWPKISSLLLKYNKKAMTLL